MNKFKLFAAFAVGGAVLAIAAGSAAGLGVGQGAIQQGTLTNLACDTNGVTVHYGTTFQINTVNVNKVFVDDLSAGCAGGEMDVVLRDSGGNSLWFGEADIPANFPGGTLQAGTAVSVPAAMSVSPAAIEGVEVSVYDTYP